MTPCGCHVREHDQQTEPEIVWCALHAAAPELREALEDLLQHPAMSIRDAWGLLNRLARAEKRARAAARGATEGTHE